MYSNSHNFNPTVFSIRKFKVHINKLKFKLNPQIKSVNQTVIPTIIVLTSIALIIITIIVNRRMYTAGHGSPAKFPTFRDIAPLAGLVKTPIIHYSYLPCTGISRLQFCNTWKCQYYITCPVLRKYCFSRRPCNIISHSKWPCSQKLQINSQRFLFRTILEYKLLC